MTTAGAVPIRRARGVLVVAVKYALFVGGLVATALVSAFITFSLAIRGGEVAVPDLSRADLTTASQKLAEVELALKPEGRRADAEVPLDHVVSQEPAAGAKLKKGRSVKVWVSLGPPSRNVPRVEGEPLQSAQLILEQSGFALGRVAEVTTREYSPDTVIAQDPPAYAEAGDAREVSLLVSRGYPGEAYVMPDFIGREIADALDRVRVSNFKMGGIRYQEYPGVAKGLVVRQAPPPGSKVFAREPIVLYVSKGS